VKRWWWMVKSLSLNACGSAIDYALLLVAAKVLLLPTPAATMIGIAVGATFNFLMNRRFAFRSTGAIGPQALRYAAAIGALMVVHAAVAWLLRDVAHVPLLFAKILADLGVLAFSQPFVLRKFVFSPSTSAGRLRQPAYAQADSV
jgi:putative flippase GtrA